MGFWEGSKQPLPAAGRLRPGRTKEFYPVFRVAPELCRGAPVKESLETGTLILDAIIPIAKGQRQLLNRRPPYRKTSVAIDAILNQKGKDVICIYCCIGKPYTSLLKVMDILNEKDALDIR